MWERRGGREEEGEGGKREMMMTLSSHAEYPGEHTNTARLVEHSLCRMSSSPPERYLILPL